MANQRDIKNRISSIKNTRKITSTMEMVSTAKMKKMQQRLEKSMPYDSKINQIIANLMTSGVSSSQNPLFREVSDPSRILILSITGNRGLCGSFNSNVIDNTVNFRDKLADEDKEVLNYVIGKKGINYFKFIKLPVYKSSANPEDKLTFEEAARISDELKELFLSGEIHEVYISYTKVYSATSQQPEIIKLLPISPEADLGKDPVKEATTTDYIFEPNAGRIFSYILPLYLKVKIFTCFLESAFSEQFARRVAMKNATDASDDMVKELTISYNRARQAKITNEIAEIVGGSAALE